MRNQPSLAFRRIRKFKNLIITVIFGTVLIVGAGYSFSARALTLTPPMLELAVEPGGEITSKIKVLNESKDTVQLYTSTANFTAKDETGNPQFLFDEKGDLADWINVNPGPIMLLPGERQEVNFTVKVPKDAPAGGHYAGIFFSNSPSQPEGERTNITVVSKLGVLLILRVSGDVTVKSALQEFHVLNNQHWFGRLPVQFWYRLGNAGNLHIRPAGAVEIKNIFGTTVASVSVNPTEGAVLPNTIRRFEPVWQKNTPAKVEYKNFLQHFFAEAKAESRNFAVGRFTAALVFSNVPESGGKVGSLSFWVFPWRLLLIILVLLLIALCLLRTFIRKYNRWVVQRYTNKK